jgi:hypothetical protein
MQPEPVRVAGSYGIRLPEEHIMSRLQTMARFAEPTEPAPIDLTGYRAWVYLSDISVRGVVNIAEARVKIDSVDAIGTYEVEKVQIDDWPTWRTLDPSDPFQRFIYDAVVAEVTPERAIEALLEAE